MSCPTCGHTMEKFLGSDPEDELNGWLCPRCGTLKMEDANATEPTIYVPKLVERCRRFEPLMSIDLLKCWHSLGLYESIHLPAERPMESG